MILKKAQNFKLTTIQGEPFECFKYQGKSYLLLIFYRGSWCNYCRRQIESLNRYYSKFRKLKIKIVAISGDSQLKTSLLTNITHSKFPLLSDEKLKVIKLYGVKTKRSRVDNPRIFLINPQREIVYTYYSKNYKDRPDTPTLLRKFQKIISSNHPD